MTPEQFQKLLELIERLISKQYTITGAADWPIIVVLGGGLVALIVYMWIDLRSVVKDNRADWRSELAEHKQANEKEFDLLWKAQHDCQSECCPRKKQE